MARSIHFNGPNAAKPFVPVDCGCDAYSAMIEGELFGYVKNSDSQAEADGPFSGRERGLAVFECGRGDGLLG